MFFIFTAFCNKISIPGNGVGWRESLKEDETEVQDGGRCHHTDAPVRQEHEVELQRLLLCLQKMLLLTTLTLNIDVIQNKYLNRYST